MAAGVSANLIVPITKKAPQADGSVIVSGVVTDDVLDRDGQIVDPASAAKALTKWFDEAANVRQMHSPFIPPAGKALTLDLTGAAPVISAKIVEPTAVKLIQEGVYSGFSIGMIGEKIVYDPEAPNGRLKDFMLREVSVVDYPACPTATLSIVKRRKDADGLFMDWSQTHKVYGQKVTGKLAGQLVSKLREHQTVTNKDATTPQSVVASELATLSLAIDAANNNDFTSATALGNAAVAMSDILKGMLAKNTPQMVARKTLDTLIDQATSRWAQGQSTNDLSAPLSAAMTNIQHTIGTQVNDQVTPTSKSHQEVASSMDTSAAKAADDKPAPDTSVGDTGGGGVVRSKIPKKDFVFPADAPEGGFPITDPDDVTDAVHSWGHYKGNETFDTFKTNLIKICIRKGDAYVKELPDTWADDLKAAQEKRAAKKAAKCEKRANKNANKGGDFEPAPYSPGPDETVICPDCGCQNDTDASYCDQCGKKLEGKDNVVELPGEAEKRAKDGKGTAEDEQTNRKPAAASADADEGAVPCPTCGGQGKILEGHRQCPDCDGTGRVTKEEAKKLALKSAKGSAKSADKDGFDLEADLSADDDVSDALGDLGQDLADALEDLEEAVEAQQDDFDAHGDAGDNGDDDGDGVDGKAAVPVGGTPDQGTIEHQPSTPGPELTPVKSPKAKKGKKFSRKQARKRALKALGKVPTIDRMVHDLVCPAFSGKAVGKTHGKAIEMGFPHILGTEYLRAEVAQLSLDQANPKLLAAKSRYLANVAKVAEMPLPSIQERQAIAHKAFQNTYPSVNVKPGDITPDMFHRAYLSGDTAATAKPGQAPHIPSGSQIKPEDFNRGALTTNEQRQSPEYTQNVGNGVTTGKMLGKKKGKDGKPAKPGRLFYRKGSDGDTTGQALAKLHDDLVSIHPGVCPISKVAMDTDETGAITDSRDMPENLSPHQSSLDNLQNGTLKPLAGAVKAFGTNATETLRGDAAIGQLVETETAPLRAEIERLTAKVAHFESQPDPAQRRPRRTPPGVGKAFAARRAAAKAKAEKRAKRDARLGALVEEAYSSDIAIATEAMDRLQSEVSAKKFASLMVDYQ